MACAVNACFCEAMLVSHSSSAFRKGAVQRFHKMKSTIRKDKGKKKEKLDPMINVRCVRLDTLRLVAPEATPCSAF